MNGDNMYNERMRKTASSFLNNAYLEWQLGTRKKQTLRSFAEYLEVTEQSLSGWMVGRNIPAGENLRKLARKLGPGIYDALEIPRPAPLTAYVDEVVVELDEKAQLELRKVIHDWMSERGYRRIK